MAYLWCPDHRDWQQREMSFFERAIANWMPTLSLFDEQLVQSITPVAGGYRVRSISRTGHMSDCLAKQVVLAGGVTSTVPLLAMLPAVDKTLLGRRFTLTTELTAYVATDT